MIVPPRLELALPNVNTVYAVLMTYLTLCCFFSSSHDTSSNILEALKLLNEKHRQNTNVDLFARQSRGGGNSIPPHDLRDHKLFHSDPHFDCCPTVTELSPRTVGINPQGLVLELFHNHNFTQTFYETICHPAIKDNPCQFIDRQYQHFSRCIQQYSYVYAMGRTFGKWNEQYRIDYIRIATGCKCTLIEEDPLRDEDYMSNRIY